MSVEVNHEKVAKRLALEIADLKYQVAAYQTVVEDMQTKTEQLENTIKTFEKRDTDDDNVSAV